LAEQSVAPPSSTSATANLYVPLPAKDVAFINITCPVSLISVTGKSFTCFKDKNIRGNDIIGIAAYSWQQCIDACSVMNSVNGKDQCKAAVLGSDLSHAYASNGANCWLKALADPKYDQPPADPGTTGANIAVLNA
jgi:hypothetical protein